MRKGRLLNLAHSQAIFYLRLRLIEAPFLYEGDVFLTSMTKSQLSSIFRKSGSVKKNYNVMM